MSTEQIENETITGRVPVFKIEPEETAQNILLDKIVIEDALANVTLNENALRFLRKKNTLNKVNVDGEDSEDAENPEGGNTTVVENLADLNYEIINIGILFA